MPNGFDKLAGGVGKAIETVPDLYDDALKPVTQESGKTLALIPRTINAALVPLRQWIANKEYNLAETEKLLAKKLEHVGEDKIVTPEAYIAVPAIQAISYSMNSEELRNLYANLLAKAMNIDTKDLVHPSFVEIIKQMSPLDAKVFRFLAERKINPCINVLYGTKETGYVTLFTNITDIPFSSPNLVGLSIDNLLRLKLLNMPENEFYMDDKIYEPLFDGETIILQSLNTFSSKINELNICFTRHKLEKTNFGDSFFKQCVIDIKC